MTDKIMFELGDDLIGIIVPNDVVYMEIHDVEPYFMYSTSTSNQNEYEGVKLPFGTWIPIGKCYKGIVKYYWQDDFRNSSDRNIRYYHYEKYFKKPFESLIPLLKEKIGDIDKIKIEIIEKITYDYQGRID